MRADRCVLIAAIVLATVRFAAADSQDGRPNVLLDVHGYNHGGCVQVPLWPLTDWLGARVEDGGDWAVIRLGEKVVYLQLPRQAWTGETPVVPLRVVAEGLGAEVRYRGPETDAAATVGHVPVVEISIEGRRGLVLVHAAAPPLVTEILAVVRDEGYGLDWLLRVSAVAGDYAKTHEPQWREGFGFSQHWITGVLLRRHDEWLYLLRSSKVSHTQAELAEAGIPLDVAQQLGMEIEDLEEPANQ